MLGYPFLPPCFIFGSGERVAALGMAARSDGFAPLRNTTLDPAVDAALANLVGEADGEFWLFKEDIEEATRALEIFARHACVGLPLFVRIFRWDADQQAAGVLFPVSLEKRIELIGQKPVEWI